MNIFYSQNIFIPLLDYRENRQTLLLDFICFIFFFAEHPSKLKIYIEVNNTG
jgi:hypothetical protein